MSSGPPTTRAAARRPLSHDRILDMARTLLDEDGAAPFSMRRLAERLGVTPMALYKWYDNRDHLLDALTARTIEAPMPGVELVGSWEERAVQLASAVRRRLLDHLVLLKIDGASRRLTTAMLGLTDLALSLMVEIGYDEQAAVDAYRVLFWSTIDFCLVIDATDAMPASQGADWFAEQLARSEVDATSSLPTLSRLLPRLGPVDRDEFFTTTIETIVAGLRARAPKG